MRTRRCFDRGMPRVRVTAGSWLALPSFRAASACRRSWSRRSLRHRPAPSADRRRRLPPDAASTGRNGCATARRDRCAAAAGCRRSPQETLQHRRRLADDAARPADRHPGARREGGRAAAAPGCQRRLAALQLDRAGGAPPDADELRAVPRPAGPAASVPPRRGWRRSRRPARRAGHDGLVQPTFKGGSPVRLTRLGAIPTASCDRRSAAARGAVEAASDPDGVIRPTFAVRPRWSAFAADPDGLIAPDVRALPAVLAHRRRRRSDRPDADPGGSDRRLPGGEADAPRARIAWAGFRENGREEDQQLRAPRARRRRRDGRRLPGGASGIAAPRRGEAAEAPVPREPQPGDALRQRGARGRRHPSPERHRGDRRRDDRERSPVHHDGVPGRRAAVAAARRASGWASARPSTSRSRRRARWRRRTRSRSSTAISSPRTCSWCPDPMSPGGERVKVLDFGIAKLRPDWGGSDGAKTRTGVIFGTPAYMSPEQCRGLNDEVDGATDVYALGCILFEMLCGRAPYISPGWGDVLMMHMSDDDPGAERGEPARAAGHRPGRADRAREEEGRSVREHARHAPRARAGAQRRRRTRRRRLMKTDPVLPPSCIGVDGWRRPSARGARAGPRADAGRPRRTTHSLAGSEAVAPSSRRRCVSWSRARSSLGGVGGITLALRRPGAGVGAAAPRRRPRPRPRAAVAPPPTREAAAPGPRRPRRFRPLPTTAPPRSRRPPTKPNAGGKAGEGEGGEVAPPAVRRKDPVKW